MENQAGFTPGELAALKELIKIFRDESFIRQCTAAMKAYEVGAATSGQIDCLRQLLGMLKEAEYLKGLEDPEVQRRFDETPAPDSKPRLPDKSKDE